MKIANHIHIYIQTDNIENEAASITDVTDNYIYSVPTIPYIDICTKNHNSRCLTVWSQNPVPASSAIFNSLF